MMNRVWKWLSEKSPLTWSQDQKEEARDSFRTAIGTHIEASRLTARIESERKKNHFAEMIAKELGRKT